MAEGKGISQRRSSLLAIEYATLYKWNSAIIPIRMSLRIAFTEDARQKQEMALDRFEKVLKTLLEGGVKVGDPIYDIAGNVLGAYVEDDPENLRFFVEPFIDVEASDGDLHAGQNLLEDRVDHSASESVCRGTDG